MYKKIQPDMAYSSYELSSLSSQSDWFHLGMQLDHILHAKRYMV